MVASKQREERSFPLLWRRPVTVCIAALCDSGETIISVVDRRVGMEFVEADTVQKIGWLHTDWRSLLAGDFSAASEVARLASVCIGMQHGKLGEIGSRSVKDCLVAAYERVRIARAEAQYLKSRGWSLEEFKQKGHSSLPESTFTEIDRSIRTYDLGVDLIAYGFMGKYGEIIQIANPCIVSFESDSAFSAIGTGSVAALSSLYARELTRHTPLSAALYYVYEAKIAAERASGVGESSYLTVMKQREEFAIDQHDVLRSIWKRLKPKDLSVGDLKKIESISKRKLTRITGTPASGG